MKINIKEVPAAPSGPAYPVIKRHTRSSLLVLFVEPKKGLVLRPANLASNLGEFYQDWAEEEFSPTSDTVTISNN